MNLASKISDLIEEARAEESELLAEVNALSAQLAEAQNRLQRLQHFCEELESRVGDLFSASTSSAPTAAAHDDHVAPTVRPSSTSIPNPEPATGSGSAVTVPKRRGRPPKSRTAEPRDVKRKGRRKAGGSTRLHTLGIVDAAFAIAQDKGVREADAGQILEWFKEFGYKSRNGTPTRNSIYVSLNREYTEGKKRGENRVERPSRGKFVFNFD